MKNIKLYSLPNCVACKVLKDELIKNNIEFRVVDDMESLVAANIMTVPQLSIIEDNNEIILNFNQSIDWINREVK